MIFAKAVVVALALIAECLAVFPWSEDFEKTAEKGSDRMEAVYGQPCPGEQRYDDVDSMIAQGFKLSNYTEATDKFREVTNLKDFIVLKASWDNDNAYEFYVNFIHGLVIVNYMSRYNGDIYSWSEALFILYKNFAPEFNTQTDKIKQITHYSISYGTVTWEIMEEIHAVWYGEGTLGDKEEGYDVQPYSVEWNAIIGTTNGKGQAYFLAQH